MKSLTNHIFEMVAKKKPSDLKKLKDTSKEVNVRFKGSDRYDLSDDGYTDKFKYYSGETDGYIMDKEGNVYDVEISKFSSDSGYIAGGTMNWASAIRYKDNKIMFKGWHGLFSDPSSETASTIVSDLKDGMYLEDYVAKHYKDLDPYSDIEKDYIKELISKGDKNAKTYAGIKSDNKENKKYKLYIENIYLGDSVYFEIGDNKLNISMHIVSRAYDNITRKVKKDDLNEEEIKNKLSKDINDFMIPMLKKFIGNNILKTNDIFEYQGISGFISTKVEKSYCQFLMFNVKKNKFVIVDTDEHKIVNENPELFLENSVTLNKNKASDKAKSLFKRASDEFQKLNKRKQGEYIEQNYTKFYSWQDGVTSVSKQKAKAKEAFKKMLIDHDYDSNENRFVLSWQLLKDFIEDGRITDPETNKPVTSNQNSDNEKSNDASKKVSDKAMKSQEEKMDKWHNGERNQNIKVMSDSKLKINYKICKDKNYTKEMNILKQEAENRGLNLNERLSIKNYFNLLTD